MAGKDASLKPTAHDLSQAFADPAWAGKYPPVLTTDQVADLLQVPKSTVYAWSSQGLLKGCCRRVGKHLRFFRDRVLHRAFNEGLHDPTRQ